MLFETRVQAHLPTCPCYWETKKGLFFIASIEMIIIPYFSAILSMFVKQCPLQNLVSGHNFYSSTEPRHFVWARQIFVSRSLPLPPLSSSSSNNLLKETVPFLKSPPGAQFRGAATFPSCFSLSQRVGHVLRGKTKRKAKADGVIER